MPELAANFPVSSDPSVPLENLPIGGLPVTFSGVSLEITIPVNNADFESGKFTSITIVEIGGSNIASVTVSYKPQAAPSTPVTVVTNAAPGTIDIPFNPRVVEITLIIYTVNPTDDTYFDVGAAICLEIRGKL